MARILFLVITSYLAVLIGVYFGQRYLQYYPDTSYPGKPAGYNVPEMREIRVKTDDGLELLAWFAPPKNKDGKVIVLYHGNAGNIGGRAFKARVLMDAGYGVYLCEYRGYGGNGGSLSEQGIYQDARAALRWLDKNGYPPSQWVIYGESIGSGPAVQMAMEFQAKSLIIEGGFSSATDVAKSVYFWLPVDVLMKDKFDNLSKIKFIKASLLMLHGSDDNVVPYALGMKLYDAANHPKQFVMVDEGGHNDLYDHHGGEVILNWLSKI